MPSRLEVALRDRSGSKLRTTGGDTQAVGLEALYKALAAVAAVAAVAVAAAAAAPTCEAAAPEEDAGSSCSISALLRLRVPRGLSWRAKSAASMLERAGASFVRTLLSMRAGR